MLSHNNNLLLPDRAGIAALVVEGAGIANVSLSAEFFLNVRSGNVDKFFENCHIYKTYILSYNQPKDK